MQVHRARLLSGEQVVVKVQRPGLKRLFDIDLANLRVLAKQLDAQEEGRDFTGTPLCHYYIRPRFSPLLRAPCC